MTERTWRLDPIGSGNVAWLCLIPHAVNWTEPAGAAQDGGYTITEETQTLVHNQLGGCLRYLAIKLAWAMARQPA